MSNLIIVEGFDMVGKTSYLESIHSPGYRPDYDMLDSFYERNLAGLFFFMQADLLYKTDLVKSDTKLTLDRSSVSGYVYSRIYPSDVSEFPSEMVIESIKRMCSVFDTVEIVHVIHSCRESAKQIYFQSHKDGSHLDKLDQFDSFDAYFRCYQNAESYYREIYISLIDSIVDDVLHLAVVKSDALTYPDRLFFLKDDLLSYLGKS